MSRQRIIVVVGATGAQGGGLARAILTDPARPFSLRAVTRRPESIAARRLADLGADVATADLDDPASIERAFDGAYGVFCVTFFWSDRSPEREIRHAGTMATAARRAGVTHAIWSTLEDTRQWLDPREGLMPVLQNKYNVPHFDAKGEADELFRRSGVPTTFMLTSFYWDNLINFPGLALEQQPDSTLVLTLPMGGKKLPGIAAEDIGRCAYGVFLQHDSLVGRTIGIAGQHLTGAEMAAALSRALNRPVEYRNISPDAYRSMPLPAAVELGNMFQFKRDFEEIFCGARSVEMSRSLNPELQTFERWLGAHQREVAIRPADPAHSG